MVTLQSLLEKEKTSFIETLKAQPDSASMIKQADNLLSRILFAYNEAEESDKVKASAYSILQTVRTSLDLIDSTGETKVYTRTAMGKQEKGNRPGRFWLLLCIGAACVFAAAALVVLTVRKSAVVIDLPVLLVLLVVGMAALFLSGSSSSSPVKNSGTVETETKPDAEKIYRHLLGTLITADHLLEDVRTEEMIEARHALEKDRDGMNQKEISLLAQLLEDAYADKSSDLSRETISHIRYYLHNRRIETVEYSREDADFFDILPGEGGTIRPALVMDGTLVKKGLAAGGR